MNWEEFFRNYRTPDFIPGFAILNKLGSGAFGEVYRARRTSIGKDYAIKFLRVQDERLHEQVLRELEGVDQLARVDHPNLVSIEDRGEVCGIPYIVMGFAGDETLKHLLAAGPLPVEKAIQLFRQVLRGVACLHQHGIIHFDLKPGNVFIRGDVARVGDYGLSKLMSESRATLSMGRGTPAYMAPEMLRRRGDSRSDVYSLGVILFEILSGDVPFRGENEWEILRRHETDEVTFDQAIPRAFRDFLRRSLAKDPSGRFPSAAAQLASFEEAAAGLLPGAGSPSVILESRPGGGEPVAPAQPPQCGESPGRRVGRVAGCWIAGGHATLERVRSGIADILQDVRDQTRHAVIEAKLEFRRRKHAAAAAPPSEPRGGASSPASGARLRWFLWGARWVRRIVATPFRILDYLFRHAVQALVVVFVTAILCALAHLGLRGLIF